LYKSPQLLETVRDHRFVELFRASTIPGILIWVADKNNIIIDITVGVADYFQCSKEDMLGKSVFDFVAPEHYERLRNDNEKILEAGRAINNVRWIEMPTGWRKFVSTRSPLGGEFIITVSHDITDKEPANHWMLQLDLVNRRLNLGEQYGNQYLKLPELLILHRLVRGQSYKEIAGEFNLSIPTVKYRLARIKDMLDVNSMVDVWSEIFSCGLVHLLALPLGLEQMPETAEDLFKLDPSSD
jgi:PAS domain S-box-containing protein